MPSPDIHPLQGMSMAAAVSDDDTSIGDLLAIPKAIPKAVTITRFDKAFAGITRPTSAVEREQAGMAGDAEATDIFESMAGERELGAAKPRGSRSLG